MKKGFTLSEVLITLGIVAIVSAIMIPAVMNQKPNQNKITFLKFYDTLVEQIQMIASTSTYFPSCQDLDGDGNEECFVGAPLFNNTRGVGDVVPVGQDGDAKLCYLLASQFSARNPVCPNAGTYIPNRQRSFTAQNGADFYINTARVIKNPLKTSTYITEIVFDINGSGEGDNCIFDAGNKNACPNPDMFRLYVLADGDVRAGDRASERYLETRKNLRGALDVPENVSTNIAMPADITVNVE